MNKLEEQPNIGTTLALKLVQAEIFSFEELSDLGSEKAFIKLFTIDKTVCINSLYAIEGAIKGTRWHFLSDERKAELKCFFKNITKK